MKLSLLELARTQYIIQGNATGTLTDMKELVDFLTCKSVNYSHVEHVSLEEVNETLKRSEKGKIMGRALIKFQTFKPSTLNLHRNVYHIQSA